MRGATWARLVLAGAVAFFAAACDEDTRDDVERRVEQAGARVTAEAFRGVLESKDLGDDENLRTVRVLRDSADDLPGSPTVDGIVDGDGDGEDDDGRVEFDVDGEKACVQIEADGDDVEVEGGACDEGGGSSG
jgi:hypothetical protein